MAACLLWRQPQQNSGIHVVMAALAGRATNTTQNRHRNVLRFYEILTNCICICFILVVFYIVYHRNQSSLMATRSQ